ncbi:MAG: helix-turn-helix transcriptional regulator, partial [Saccharofermentans sp.]|nr:helix-turn-helix transcriptional regulator [Saccharofermentans sp.]
LAEKGMSTADMQKKSGIDRTYIYQIMDGSKNPGRDKIIAMAVACKMTLPECQRALEIAQEGILYAKNRRDSLIIYAIGKKMNIAEINGLLDEYKFEPLD